MSRVVQVSVSDAEFYPSSSSNPLELTTSNLSNGYNDFLNGTYAQITLRTGSNAESYFYFNFNLNIPNGATIDSVSCYARASLTSTTGVSYRRIQLYTGTTAKGNAVALTASVSGVTGTDLASGTTWTAAELNNAALYLYAQRGTSSTTSARYFRFYGATLTVSYTYNQTQYEVTASSSVQGVTVSSAQEWVNAGEDYDLDIYGDISHADVTDNNIDVTSSIVTIGTDEHRYSITNISADHSILIVAQTPTGDKIFVKVNGTWQEAADIKVKVSGAWQSVSKAYKKVSGSWVEQSDKSAIFDPNALYLKG